MSSSPRGCGGAAQLVSIPQIANAAVLLFAATMFWPQWVHGAEAGEVELSLGDSWFKPALVESRSEVCAAVLEEADALFHSRVSRLDTVQIAVKGMDVVQWDRDLDTEPLTEIDPRTGQPVENPQHTVTTGGKKIYLSLRTNPGCGGGCETQQPLAALAPFRYWDESRGSETLSQPPPAAPEFTLLRKDGALYTAVVARGQLQFYQLTSSAAWEGICKVSMQPADLHTGNDAELQSIRKAIDDLRVTVGAITQGAGFCGSLKTHRRLSRFINEAFERALYRPWTLYKQSQAPWNDRQAGTRFDHLTAWSLLGIDEYAAFAQYRSQLSVTSSQLAKFYERRFGWSETESALAAGRALVTAVDHGFSFSNTPILAGDSLRVRQAILENKPIAEIRNLGWSPATGGGEPSPADESVLSVAIDHPDALRWLLEKGENPNHANAFGKTPLMYAAQRNALDAVNILLAHGADPNAATLWPWDSCFYTLSRVNVTPLHYAARYASAEILKALLDGGAVTFIRTDQRQGSSGEFPLDWLRAYGSPTAAERNPNIGEADLPRLEKLLRHLDAGELAAYSDEQVAQAQAQYAGGNVSAAHQSLKMALQANPENARALSDMSLVALRAGFLGESLQAATRLTSGGQDSRTAANAWFNIGLACEKNGQTYLHYNDVTYCTSSKIFPFLQSWLTAKSQARAEKLEQLFAATGDKRCAIGPTGAAYRYIFALGRDSTAKDYRQVQHIYVLHPAGSKVAEAEIQWQIPVRVPGKSSSLKTITPQTVSSHPMGRSTITVLEAQHYAQSSVQIGGHSCF